MLLIPQSVGVLARPTVAAFLLNMHWIVTFGEQRSALAIGYFLWLLSFFLLAVGLLVSVRDTDK